MRKASSACLPWLFSLAALAACGESEGRVPGRLHELERMAFVPAGFIELGFLAPPENRWVVPEPLLFDRFEATREDWIRSFGEPSGEERWSSPQARWTAETGTWPAFMSQREAQEYASLRGMRLPSAHEWLFAAMGPVSSKHPWGLRPQQSVANTLELGLRRPAPVGSFELDDEIARLDEDGAWIRREEGEGAQESAGGPQPWLPILQ